MTTEQEVYDEIERLKALKTQLSQMTSDSSLRSQKELVETLRSSSLLSGAVSVGALVLLGTEVLTEKSLILLGIVDLLILTVFVIGYLLHSHLLTIVNNEVFTYDVLNRFDDLFRHIEARQLPESGELLNELTTQIDQILETQPTDKKRFRFLEVLILASLGFGFFMIVLGLLLPQTCIVWGLFCV